MAISHLSTNAGAIRAARARLQAWPFPLTTAGALTFEACIVILGYRLYSFLRYLVAGSESTAVGHGWGLYQAEERLGLAFERPLQQLALSVPGAVHAFDFLYVAMHRPFLATGAVYLFFRDRRVYRRARRAFFIACAIGIAIFWALPVAPPRLLPGAGFVDTIRVFMPQASYQPGTQANEFAAVPSFHIGWNLLVVACMWRVTASRWARALLVVPPVLMVLTVLVTANHYWLDGVIGVLVVGVAYFLACLPERRHAAHEYISSGYTRMKGRGV